MQKENNSNLFNFIKERVSILEVINQHVSLKKAGHYWKGQCPFHDEKTASFTVSPHKEIFYCFGCHVGGDVITFMTKVENCEPLEAVKQLADRHNIELPQTVSHPTFKQTIDDKKRYFEVCRVFAEWTHAQITKYPSIISYLNKRGFNEKSIKQFMVGYFPGGERSIKTLIKELNKQNFLVKDLLDVHLIQDGKANFYSPFEQRIIFPIADHLGRFCGFGGRIIKSTDQRPKYYNSRENSYFQKGSLLFGMDQAKKTIQKTGKAFLVEGYTDCIAMVQHGLKNTVATLGTACTVEHLKLLSYHAQTVYLVYDSDAAGHKAMLRLAELCWQVNLDLQTLFLPPGQDPASFLQKGGDLQKLSLKAQDILAFFLSSMGQEFTTQSLQEKLAGMRRFLVILKRLDDPLKQGIFLQKAAATFGLPFDALKKEFDRTSFGPVEKKLSDTLPPNKPALEGISTIEKKFACAILNNAQLLKKKEVARLVEYMPPELQNAVKKLRNIKASTDKNAFIHFFESLEYHEKQVINQLMLGQEEPGQNDDFDQLLLLIQKKYWKMIVNGTKVKIAQAQLNDNAQMVNDIVVSFLELKKKLLCKGLI